MARTTKWHDDYWLLLMQAYLQKPVGIKPMYSRKMVELSLELHISPERLYDRMRQLAHLDAPRLERIWATYSRDPRKLARAARLLREMNGFNHADTFYDGVEVNEGFERDFKPVADDSPFTPVMLTLILDLYFRLTPQTMVVETPEVVELSRLMKVKSQEVVDVLELFQHCDPYLNRRGVMFHPLLLSCQTVWRRFGNTDAESLASYAEQLKDYFRT